jgi:hypothetical protein
MWVSDKQKAALKHIKELNELQKTVWLDTGIEIVKEAIDRIKARNDDLEKSLVFEIMKVAYELESTKIRRMFTKGELPGITLHTLQALEDKGILKRTDTPGIYGATYWEWTGKELEESLD